MLLRRIVALAEMVGLPQAQHDVHRNVGPRSQDLPSAADMETRELKATVWEAICATDRNFSMMMNLPAGTSRYAFPRDPSVMRDNRVLFTSLQLPIIGNLRHCLRNRRTLHARRP